MTLMRLDGCSRCIDYDGDTSLSAGVRSPPQPLLSRFLVASLGREARLKLAS